MTTPLEAMDRLSELAQELDQRSRELAEVERNLESAEITYQASVDEFEVGLWKQYEDSEFKTKFPSEAMRRKLAHQQMDPALLGRYIGLVNSRRRLEKRISALKTAVDAQRSLLSALKTELEVMR